MRIERTHVQPVAENAKATVYRTATNRRGKIGRQSAPVIPERNARSAVNCPSLVIVPRYVENSVHDQRCVLYSTSEHARNVRLEDPLRHKPRDVLRRQLLQRTVPLARVVAGKSQPARGILQTIQQVLIGDLRQRWLLLPCNCMRAERQNKNRRNYSTDQHRIFKPFSVEQGSDCILR